MRRILLVIITGAVAVFYLTGCFKHIATKVWDKHPFDNYYLDYSATLKVRRALVLPFTNESGFPGASREVTEMFVMELRKQNRFDVVTPDSFALASLSTIRHGSALTNDDVVSICREFGVDALIVGELREYVPYRPFVVGMRFSMFTADRGRLIWQVDETLDCSMKTVESSARSYYYHLVSRGAYTMDVEVMTSSIRMFTQFACYSLVSTLENAQTAKK